MYSFEELALQFKEKFEVPHFPAHPASLYEPNNYFLTLGGKRIRPVLCLMGNELFEEINPDAFHVAAAIELFHNFTLIHDDIMDKAPLRRGMQTVHEKYGSSTALLAGDVMLVAAYDYLNKINNSYSRKIIHHFNKTAREVCEGQQLDMDFEKKDNVHLDEYLKMIELKTSVLLASSLKMGAILGGAGLGNQQLIYEFGKNLGIAFQVQDDYLDAFGDPEKFGKQKGGDIIANKKTFLLIHALEAGNSTQQSHLKELLNSNNPDKVEKVVRLFQETAVDKWAVDLKEKYMASAMQNLEDIAVISSRKQPLSTLANYLMTRAH
ncbi:MAG: polyprenyl synthetase family protein [Gemmatimonadaceae bacterium]|nr:polyprenyl synthetase family protein [Chitinophagaceae bacterium]